MTMINNQESLSWTLVSVRCKISHKLSLNNLSYFRALALNIFPKPVRPRGHKVLIVATSVVLSFSSISCHMTGRCSDL